MELTPEQQAYMKKLADPHYYGDQDENGIDLSLIRRNLQLTPMQRLRKAAYESQALLSLRNRARRIPRKPT
jgi:hypothetical protein